MTDRPILFSGPMVRALLDGRKTQTRRILKDQPGDLDKPLMMDDGSWHVTSSRGDHLSPIGVRFRKGDRLWVRETAWYDPKICDGLDGLRCFYEGKDVRHEFRSATATAPFASTAEMLDIEGCVKKRPGIHMPRWASRLTLTVTEVRVQRIQDISQEDAKAEGLEWVAPTYGVNGIAQSWSANPVTAFWALWLTINGPESLRSNPWVVAVTFTVEKRNIDA